MIRNFIARYPFRLALVWAAIIFVLCSTPGRFIPTTHWLEWISFDKWVHASIFFVLTSLCIAGVAVNGQPRWCMYLFAGLAIAYGGGLEIMQAKVFSERSGDWADFTANSFGCLVALAMNGKVRKMVGREG